VPNITFYPASQIRVSGARNLPASHRLSTGFSAAQRIAQGTQIYQQRNIMQEFFYYFLMSIKLKEIQ
jgi:hypothetical protein